MCKGLSANSQWPGQATRAWVQSSGRFPVSTTPARPRATWLLASKTDEGWKGVILLVLIISYMSFVPGWACPCMHTASQHSCSAQLGRRCNWGSAHVGVEGDQKERKQNWAEAGVRQAAHQDTGELGSYTKTTSAMSWGIVRVRNRLEEGHQ